MVETLTDEERKMIGEAAELIYDNFAWNDTIQGGYYWAEVYENLIALSEGNGLKCDSCGQEICE